MQRPLHLHVLVHILADKLDIPLLAELARSNFVQRVRFHWDDDHFVDAIRELYENARDTGERDMQKAAWMSLWAMLRHYWKTEDSANWSIMYHRLAMSSRGGRNVWCARMLVRQSVITAPVGARSSTLLKRRNSESVLTACGRYRDHRTAR